MLFENNKQGIKLKKGINKKAIFITAFTFSAIISVGSYSYIVYKHTKNVPTLKFRYKNETDKDLSFFLNIVEENFKKHNNFDVSAFFNEIIETKDLKTNYNLNFKVSDDFKKLYYQVNERSMGYVSKFTELSKISKASYTPLTREKQLLELEEYSKSLRLTWVDAKKISTNVLPSQVEEQNIQIQRYNQESQELLPLNLSKYSVLVTQSLVDDLNGKRQYHIRISLINDPTIKKDIVLDFTNLKKFIFEKDDFSIRQKLVLNRPLAKEFKAQYDLLKTPEEKRQKIESIFEINTSKDIVFIPEDLEFTNNTRELLLKHNLEKQVKNQNQQNPNQLKKLSFSSQVELTGFAPIKNEEVLEVEQELSKIKSLESKKAYNKILPSQISSTSILKDFFQMPQSVNGIDFSIELEKDGANDNAGTLSALIYARKKSVVESKKITIDGFLKLQDYLDLTINAIDSLKLKNNYSTLLPSNVELNDLEKIVDLPENFDGFVYKLLFEKSRFSVNDEKGTIKVTLQLSKDNLTVEKKDIQISGFRTIDEFIRQNFSSLGRAIRTKPGFDLKNYSASDLIPKEDIPASAYPAHFGQFFEFTDEKNPINQGYDIKLVSSEQFLSINESPGLNPKILESSDRGTELYAYIILTKDRSQLIIRRITIRGFRAKN
ncbi:unknown; predicted coding region [Mycoplasmopsis pulmonis]|uniref:Lipoprotein-associated type-17 domain-containing protein n=1 Tax=Mycoplasmopsis pulmonis (strain UAB CTIP) TaxID=272635 RepID=Q98PQ0_MYCPU|nr:lipoprotein 17-related variable surface protein [Mycoplasmopsis pulmonis]CAC13842.1 unknown; predicted coding region [Mycoplasmopsis pulmonis]